MQAITERAFPLLLRLQDPYGDAHFTNEELPQLLTEIDSLVDSTVDHYLVRFCEGLKRAVTWAHEQNHDFWAFGD